MTISLKHTFQSAKADGTDSTLIQPSSWNAEHTLTLATARLVGRTSTGAGAAEEISVGTNLNLSSGTLAHATSGVTAGSYAQPTITVDAQGHITSVTALGYTPFNKAGDSMTGKFTSQAFAAAMNSTGDTALEVRNNGGTGDSNMAMIGFHCTGSYGIKAGLRSDGFFGIGGWSRPGWSWYTASDGSMYAAGNITAYSDERLKTNWRDLPADFVEQLAGVKSGIYDRIDEEITQVGVSAQSLRPVMPEAVMIGEDGDTLSVAYGNAALAAAVELAKRCVELEARIAALEETVK